MSSWLLTLLPPSIISFAIVAILLFGLFTFTVGLLSSVIPFINKKAQIPLQICGVILMAIGIYFGGYYNATTSLNTKLVALEQRAKLAEQKSQEVVTIIEEKIIIKTEEVEKVRVVYQDRIIEKEKIIDANCEVPQEALDILNSSARNILP